MTMRPRLSFIIASLAFTLTGAHANTSAAIEPRREIAAWVSQQLHQPVDATQVLSAPDDPSLDGCSIMRLHMAATGGLALVLRCPTHPLPQLVLLRASSNIPQNATALRAARPHCIPLVRAGAALHADWRTSALHAELPVVALDSGADGAEIRVRVSHSSRILRARILNANNVAIVSAGA
jgi:hypothetical protein